MKQNRFGEFVYVKKRKIYLKRKKEKKTIFSKLQKFIFNEIKMTRKKAKIYLIGT